MNYRQFTAITLAGCITAAQAQSSETDNDAGVLTDPGTEVLSASQDLQWTPHSITVLTREQLESAYRPDLEHIESLVPGLIVDRMNRTPRGAAIAIRGLGSSSPSKAIDPAVAVNVDGVYVGTHTGRMQVLFDFDRIEVRKGPQGVVDNNPNLSGSINIERTRPSGVLDADLRASVGIDKRREADAVFNFPVVDSVNAKVAMYWKDRGGDYMTNVFSGREENTEDYAFVSTSVSWDLDNWFKLLYTFDHEDSDESSPAILNISAPTDLLCDSTSEDTFPNCRRGTGNPELDSLKTTAQNYSNERFFEGDYHTLRVDFEVADHQVTSITGLRESDEKSDLDLDGSNADFYHARQLQEYRQFSQEVTVSRDFSENMDYSFGIYFLNTDYDLFQQEHHILKQLGDAGFTEGHSAGEIQELASSQKSDMWSVFAHVNYILNDQWQADIGARWSDVEREFDHIPSRIRLGDTVSPIRTQLVGEENTKQFLWMGGLSYQVDEEAMIYFRYSEGFLPGGFDENAMS
jgi:iron complex outermembrane receptor protein